jgi:putative flavoprotein involved in K+ transport
MAAIRELDLEDRGVSTVIWATGFTGDFSYLSFDVGLDDHGIPVHTGGASPVDGLFYVGFPWLRIQMSGLVGGSTEDAPAVVEALVARREATR